MKGRSTQKGSFKVSMPKAMHADKGPAVPASYAHEMSVLNRVTSKVMRVASRRHR